MRFRVTLIKFYTGTLLLGVLLIPSAVHAVAHDGAIGSRSVGSLEISVTVPAKLTVNTFNGTDTRSGKLPCVVSNQDFPEFHILVPALSNTAYKIAAHGKANVDSSSRCINAAGAHFARNAQQTVMIFAPAP